MVFLRLDNYSLTLWNSKLSEEVQSSNGRDVNPLYRTLTTTHTLPATLRELTDHHHFSESHSIEVVTTSPVTMIPIAFFEEELCETYYRFSVLGEEEQPKKLRFFYDVLPTSNAVLVHALEEEKWKALEQLPSQHTHYISTFTTLLSHFARQTSLFAKKRIYLYYRGDHLDIAAFDDTQLLLFNTFELYGKTDVAYHTFNVVQQLGMNVADFHFVICGNARQISLLQTELKRFLKDVEVLTTTQLPNNQKALCDIDIPFDFILHISSR